MKWETSRGGVHFLWTDNKELVGCVSPGQQHHAVIWHGEGCSWKAFPTEQEARAWALAMYQLNH